MRREVATVRLFGSAAEEQGHHRRVRLRGSSHRDTVRPRPDDTTWLKRISIETVPEPDDLSAHGIDGQSNLSRPLGYLYSLSAPSQARFA